jgi:electron transfer flavoprotein alpha subunit
MKAVAEINSLVLDGNTVKTKRFFYGGKSIVEEESDAKIFTFVPGISEASEADTVSQVEKLALKPSKINVVSVEEKNTGGVDIEKSQAIVSVGRGIGNKEGLSVVEPLAAVLNGVVAGSRPVCLDYHWLSEDRQVGLSGKKVRPKVYIAIGISGQIQHIAGMRGSKVVIAINKDKSAPIFEECDYGIVGDLFQIVPKIVEGMKK